MPQMFPLLWLYLFIASASALFLMMSCIHFSAKKGPDSLSSYNTKSNDHNWKW